MEIDSPIEITKQEAIDKVEELWSRLFSVEARIDADNLYTDRGTKRTSEDPNDRTPTKSSQNGMAGNSDPLPPGYKRGTCDECVEIVLKWGHKHGTKKKTTCNWGLLLYVKKVSPKVVHNIEDRIIKYLVETTKMPINRRPLTCFVCDRRARGNSHNIKDCIQIADVLMRADGSLGYTKGSGRPLNTCVKGVHLHQTYAKQLECATKGHSPIQVIKEFEKLERKGATPCSWCGNVFPTHQPTQCPNHPYLSIGDQGFKAAYEARAAAVLERLQVVASKITGEETAIAACPSCTESDEHHNWRSYLKRMKCYQNREGRWETEPPGDPQELPEGYQSTYCENCCVVVPNHFTGNCPHPKFCNFGVKFVLIRGDEYISLIQTSQRSYLNGITDEEELCLVCNWFVMWDEGGIAMYHNPEECLKRCHIVLKEHRDQWEIKFDEEGEASLLGLCAGREHAHES